MGEDDSIRTYYFRNGAPAIRRKTVLTMSEVREALSAVRSLCEVALGSHEVSGTENISENAFY